MHRNNKRLEKRKISFQLPFPDCCLCSPGINIDQGLNAHLACVFLKNQFPFLCTSICWQFVPSSCLITVWPTESLTILIELQSEKPSSWSVR